MSDADHNASAYVRAGVDIAAGNRAVQLMKAAVQATYGPEVLTGIGAFGGLYDAARVAALPAPILVASTDGVGTKTRVAARIGRWETLGHDLVNHCVNDILVQGAMPLFFLDYVAAAKIDPEQIAMLVGGIAAACQAAGCALLGGETAEMPGVYAAGEIDVAGTIVGVVDRANLIDGSRIQAGDVVLALPSSGPHTNGYTLLRQIFDAEDWYAMRPELGGSLADALLEPHRSYLPEVRTLQAAGLDVRGLAHVTGGGVIDNLPRILPAGLGARIRRGSWAEPPIFALAAERGKLTADELFHVFNMGLGMLIVVGPAAAGEVQQVLPETNIVGEIVAQAGVVIDG